MNLDQRFYLRDEQRPDLRRVSNKVDPPEDHEVPPVGCLGLVIPLAIFFWAVVGWWVFSSATR
jgi:hypothetical protein